MFIVFFANHCPSLDQTVGAGLAATSDSQMVGLFGDMFLPTVSGWCASGARWWFATVQMRVVKLPPQVMV